jgi:hypothetical protein
MGKMALLVAVLVGCGPVACGQPDSRPTAHSSAATYYGPSAASYAPDFGNAPASTNRTAVRNTRG